MTPYITLFVMAIGIAVCAGLGLYWNHQDRHNRKDH